MGELLAYSLFSGVVLLVLYIAYRLLLARDNQPGFNRGVLLAIYGVSFLTPWLMTVFTRVIGYFTAVPKTISISGAISGTVAPITQPLWSTLLMCLFAVGIALTTLASIATWIRLIKTIRSGQKEKREGFTLVLVEEEGHAPFSWLGYVVVSRADYALYQEAITLHERAHVVGQHWIDLLIAQGVCILNWFNPAAWLMRRELMLVHEYIAVEAVMAGGLDAREYQMLLIKKAVGARFPSLANSLNHSKLKQRITMMYKTKSSSVRKMKAFALVPAFALALTAVSMPAVRAAVATISSSDLSVRKGNEKMPNDKVRVRVFKVVNINTDGKETEVVIKGQNLGNSMTVSGGTFSAQGKTYKARALECNMTDGEATITATFPFSLTGEPRHPSMTLIVDGEEIPFNLEEFDHFSAGEVANSEKTKNSREASHSTKGKKKGVSPEAGTAVEPSANGSNQPSLPLLNGVKIYVDGKEISEAEFYQLSTADIAAMTIDKSANAIRITTTNR